MLLNIEMGATSPPFGMALFVMKGVAPPDTTMGDIYRAALPFLGLDLIATALIIAFPAIALCVAVQGKCQGLLFSDYVSISPRHRHFYRHRIRRLRAAKTLGVVTAFGCPGVA